MYLKEKYLSHTEYSELQNQITEIRKLSDFEIKEYNNLFTHLLNVQHQLLNLELEIAKIRNKMVGLLDKIDTTAMDTYNDDLHLDYLTGNL